MLSDEVLNKVTERVTRRMEQANTYVLEQIGKSIAKIGKLTPSKAYQLGQLVKYGSDYDKIVKKLSRITNLNVQDIYKIFEEVAKTDQQFAKQFYKYRNKKFIPYEKNLALQQQVEAIARQTAQDYVNLSNTLAFSKVENGKVVYTNLARTYQDTIDKAILSVSQGKSTFQEQMYSVIKELASSGLKMVNYDSGRSYRADSMVRMHLKDGLRGLHNQMQQMLGEEFDADGVEISVHTNPAEDHKEIQGRQFSNEEYTRLNNGLEAKDYKGNTYTLDHDGKNGYRPISTMNCYHYIFSIVLGVSEPEYTDKQLKQIIDDNNKGFELDGKHYSMYQGTQLQRNIELELRKAKDTQIMAKASGNMELVQESQLKITQLTNKYKELNEVSGLPSKLDRARVSGYKRMKVDNVEIKPIMKEVHSKEELLSKWNEIFKDDNIKVRHILNANPELIDTQVTQVNTLLNKYKFIKNDIKNDSELNALTLQVNTSDIMGDGNYARFFGNHYIEFNEKYFKDKDLIIKDVENNISKNWWQEIDTDKYSIYPVTHEYGHLLEFKMIEKIEHENGFKGSLSREIYKTGDLKIQEEILKKVPNLADYMSKYGKSTPRFEWFAEAFTQMELGKETPLTKALKEYLEEFMEGKYVYFR